jgi:hypothetical protein
MSIIDKGLHFGLQNYFFVTQDETDPTYVYAAYQDRKGAVLIGRYRKDDTEGLYYSAAGTFAVIWAARATFTYVLPSALLDPIV